MSYIFFLIQPVFADDCMSPMVIRKILPLDGESDVPINSRIMISLVGAGDESHMDFTLRENTTNTDVDIDVSSSCYLHESHYEKHCTVELHPLEGLVENTEFTLILDGTEQHQEESFAYMTHFFTGSEVLSLEVDPPVLDIVDYVMRADEALDSCDWPGTMKYDLHVDIPDRDSDRNVILQVYDVDPVSCDLELVHTLFPAPNMSRFDFRQVLEPDDQTDHCYMIIREDWAGNTSPPSHIRCWDKDLDNDESYDGCKETLETVSVHDEHLDTTPTSQPEQVVEETLAESSSSKTGCAGLGGLYFLLIFLYRKKPSIPSHPS